MPRRPTPGAQLDLGGPPTQACSHRSEPHKTRACTRDMSIRICLAAYGGRERERGVNVAMVMGKKVSIVMGYLKKGTGK